MKALLISLIGLLFLSGCIQNFNPKFQTPTIQDTDGGMKNENAQNKIWETAYVVTALSGKTWNQIMQKFEKQKTPTVVKVAVKVAAKNSKKIIKNEMITAIAINAIIPPPVPTQIEQIEIPKKGWLAKLLASIFSIF